MNTPEQREETGRLISRLLDEDTLSTEERNRLNEILLADADARQLYMQYVDMQLEFACVVDPALEEPAETVPNNVTQMPVENPIAAAEGDSNWTREVATKRRKRWPEVILAAAAAVVLIGFVLSTVNRPAIQPSVGTLEKATGDVVFQTPETTEEAVEGIEVKANQTVTTTGDKSSAVFVFEDGTSLVVAGDTQISTVDGAKRVQVTDGAVAASVTPQPVGKPLIVSTPIADIEVVGTRFSVNHFSGLTDLAVTQGAVVLTRHSDGESIKVVAGQRVFAEPGGRLRTENLPTLASSWHADFENGQRHPNCHLGTVIKDGLPDGSKGGLQAARVPEKDQPDTFTQQAAFGTPWAEGLVLARDGTHLHVRYKMDKPGQLQAQIETRTEGPKPHLASYQFDQFKTPAPGQWIEASLPLNDFRNTNDSGDHTMTGEIPLSLLFVSPDGDAGLVIDEVRIDRSGSDSFKSEPIQ